MAGRMNVPGNPVIEGVGATTNPPSLVWSEGVGTRVVVQGKGEGWWGGIRRTEKRK